jgi:hypothetical protein
VDQQILACHLRVLIIAVRAHEYGIGIHPKVTLLGDRCVKPQLVQLVRYVVGQQVIFEFADFEVSYLT